MSRPVGARAIAAFVAADCQAKLGGQVQDWQCPVIPGVTPAWGTCTCGGGK